MSLRWAHTHFVVMSWLISCCVYIYMQFAKEKACELEDYQSVSLSGTDLEGSEEPAVKKRKIIKQVKLDIQLMV